MSLHLIFYFNNRSPFSCIVEAGDQYNRFMERYSTDPACIGWTIMKVPGLG